MIWAVITFTKIGFHYWKDAPEETKFLRNKHRHIFHITVYVEQMHNSRDVEYFAFKNWLEQNLPVIDGPQSCETIASHIKKLVETHFNNSRKVKVQVLEDNENGALVE